MSDRSTPFLRTGTYLRTYCPACDAELTHGDWVHLTAVAADGSLAVLQLSPRFNVFDKRTALRLQTGTLVEDLRCPHCERSLMSKQESCVACGAPAAGLRIIAYDVAVDLLVCSRVGCTWHGLTGKDRERLDLEEA